MNIKGHGLSLTLSKVTEIHIFKLLFLRNRLADWSQFHVDPPWDKGIKICSNGLGHKTTPISGEKLQNLLLGNQEADDLETWYTASGTWELPVFSYDEAKKNIYVCFRFPDPT